MNYAPLNYFLHADGPVARPTLLLDWVFTGITLAVCVLIAALLLIALFRKRTAAEEHTISSESGGLRWMMIGTFITIVMLFFMAIFMFTTLNETVIPPSQSGLVITVTGYDWWWKAEYDGFETANEIHIPVGVPVRIKLRSADVIHAFWVPVLAGKTQMIPGMTNQQWLQADKPGVYFGQCTQFCGLQHAHMAFEVVAETPEAFQAWEESQRKPAAKSGGTGAHIFMQQCASCHTLCGTGASGTHAPDLTHLMSRRLIGAGLMTNTPEHLADWVAHAQELKPGNQMPDFALSPQNATALNDYLATLK